MSYIPDCRAEGPYNEKNLNQRNKDVISGYDWCVSAAVESFFNNTDVYFDDDSYLMHILNEKLPDGGDYDTDPDDEERVSTYLDLIKEKLLEWIENQVRLQYLP